MRTAEEAALPAPTAEMLIVLALVEAEREKRGADWCRKHGIGRARLLLGRPVANGTVVQALNPALGAYLSAKRAADGFLRDTCQACGQCKYAKE